MRKSKRLLAVLLAAAMTVSAAGVLGVSAADDDKDVDYTVASNEDWDFESVKAEADCIAAADEVHNAAAEKCDEIFTTAKEPESPSAPIPGNVTNIKKTSYSADSVTLTWDPVADATGYNVYYFNADGEDGDWHKAGETKETEFTLKKLRNTTWYNFIVSAYIISDGKKYEGNRIIKKTATQPGQVQSLIRARSSDTIELQWDVNSKASGYKIYRSSPESGNKEVLYKTISGKENCGFVDPSVREGYIYVYNVKAYRICNGVEYTSASNRVKCLAGLCAPAFTIKTSRSKVDLEWKHNKYATRYDIYCYDKPDAQEGVILGSTTSDSYTSDLLEVGKDMYFRVYPIYSTDLQSITGTAVTRNITVSSDMYDKSMGDTYIEVSIEEQHLWYYKKGKLTLDTDVVTGNADGSHDTPTGYFKVYQRARNTTLTGPGYSSFVEYWMAFSGGCGIHDASWRSSFGGSIYKGDGSHGCVNTPIDKVKVLYEDTEIGTPVIVY